MPDGKSKKDALDTNELLKVLTAVKKGDFSVRMKEGTGTAGKVATALNGVIELNQKMTDEFGRIGKVVGKDGKLDQRASVKGTTGSWAACVGSINSVIEDLVESTTATTHVIGAIAKGDLSKTMPLKIGKRPLKGEFLKMAKTTNTMVEQLGSFAEEVTRVAQEVGTEGKLGGQAVVKDVSGTWKELTDNVNGMAKNLTEQVRNIAEVTTAVAKGDLTKKITVEARGEIAILAETINTMVNRLGSFAEEVTRVAQEVGTEGKLGGQAAVEGVSGTWKDLTDNVNGLARNLTEQVRNIAEVTTAVAKGDLSKKITVEAKGEVLDLKNIINVMVDQLTSFAEEVTRVAQDVGTEGQLGGQARVRGVSGTWKDLTDSVNGLAKNLTEQVRNIAEVTTAVAKGDLSKKITVEAKGEILELKNTINVMVDQLSAFSSEVTRIAREVGTEGKLGSQAAVRDVSGVWRDLTENVNLMASNLTEQVRNITEVTTAVAEGDLTKKITVETKGEILELKNTINAMVDQLGSFSSEVTRVAREVGTMGKLGGQAEVKGVSGTWKDLTDNVNGMAANLTEQVRNIAEVTTAVAEGDLTKKITVEPKGEILELKNTINAMIDRLGSFSSEVTRVAREVGTEGKLGGQAEVKDVSGTWKDLTDNVNVMASNLTEQVRGIAKVVTAVAKGDLTQKLAVAAKGEIATLAETINTMTDTLSIFADQVTDVAREVGVEGKLGGQAAVPGASGTWKDLTDNVNELAGNLTTQVRAIAEVATAVTEGDLTRSITAEARGEVEELKDNMNQMITTLKETTQANTKQDWLKTNLAKFTRMLQGQRDVEAVAKQILSELAPVITAQHGVFYILESADEQSALKLLASYAYKERKHVSSRFKPGEGLVGQCVLEKQRITITEAPEDYIQISSGLGEAAPLNIVVLPVLFEGDVLAVIELASLSSFSENHLIFLEQLMESVGIALNTIAAAARTEELLKQSQTMSEELQTQQEELQQTNEELQTQQEELQQANEEMEEKAKQLVEQKEEVERKNREIEDAKEALEEKAEQLTLTSKYKSEFLANMSHELRTPLNSQLILSKMLAENPEGNLTEKQVEFAETVNASGKDLLSLINDILDLSKIESGTMDVEVGEVLFADLQDDVERSFRQIAKKKKLDFAIELAEGLPKAIYTDPKRLQQVLKNLLSNAFKFTKKGKVEMRLAVAEKGWSPLNDRLNKADKVIAFSVSDTGIGVAPEKQKLIFEAFQQADGTTSRKYGGTGLGLSISREIATKLGGELRLVSTPGEGSTFTLYLPQSYPDDMAVPATTKPKDDVPGEVPVTNPVGAPVVAIKDKKEEPPVPRNEVGDDRDTIQQGDKTLLIVEDDVKFARILLDMAREKGFKGLVALRGGDGLALARKFKPDAITLDIKLPDKDGWIVLDRLKHDSDTRHIPVHIISVEKELQRGLEMGALSYLQKPANKEAVDKALAGIKDYIERKAKNLLVVEDDEVQRKSIVELIGNTDVETTAVATADEALTALKAKPFDCMVLDLKLPDMSGFDLIEKIKTDLGLLDLPIIIYTGRELTKKEETELRKVAKTIIVKDVKSPERLLDETALFLHRVEANLPEEKRKMIHQVHEIDPVLAGKKILIVDDDVRNIFAVTSVLERHKMKVVYAENGKDGIKLLKETPGIDLVLMDIMMPEMDGYETMRAIRKIRKFKNLPIVALTAKAMKGDREKCIEAGASDYIAKPVETEQLISLLRVWLYK